MSPIPDVLSPAGFEQNHTISRSSSEDTIGKHSQRSGMQLRQEVERIKRFLKPLEILHELGRAFTGQDVPNLQINSRHLMGGLTKYIMSQKPSQTQVT